jgi:hypothetical protein
LSKVKNLIPVKRISVNKDVVVIAKFLLKDSTNFINRIIINSDGRLRNLESLSIIRGLHHENELNNCFYIFKLSLKIEVCYFLNTVEVGKNGPVPISSITKFSDKTSTACHKSSLVDKATGLLPSNFTFPITFPSEPYVV